MHMHCVKAKLTVLRNIGVCAASVTWRRGGKRGSHAGQPLCNKCGVWEFRHPDSPPRLFVDEVSISTSNFTSWCCCWHRVDADWNGDLYGVLPTSASLTLYFCIVIPYFPCIFNQTCVPNSVCLASLQMTCPLITVVRKYAVWQGGSGNSGCDELADRKKG